MLCSAEQCRRETSSAWLLVASGLGPAAFLAVQEPSSSPSADPLKAGTLDAVKAVSTKSSQFQSLFFFLSPPTPKDQQILGAVMGDKGVLSLSQGAHLLLGPPQVGFSDVDEESGWVVVFVCGSSPPPAPPFYLFLPLAMARKDL